MRYAFVDPRAGGLHDVWGSGDPTRLAAQSLAVLADGAYGLIYLDPPFNTGKEQSLARMTVRQSVDGDRTGFGDAPTRPVAAHAGPIPTALTTTPAGLGRA